MPRLLLGLSLGCVLALAACRRESDRPSDGAEKVAAAAAKARHQWQDRLNRSLGVVGLHPSGDPGWGSSLNDFRPMQTVETAVGLTLAQKRRLYIRDGMGVWRRNGNGAEVRLGSNGKRLYILAVAYDKAPAQLRCGAEAIWDDDSFDFFFRTNRRAYFTYRLSVSCAGAWQLRKYPRGSYAATAPGQPCPADVHAAARRESYGYELCIDLPLAALGLPELSQGKQYLMAIHRNWRGLTAPGQVWRLARNDEPPARRPPVMLRGGPAFAPVIAVARERPSRPPRSDLPLTPTPLIALTDDFSAAPLFPPLRAYQGDEWRGDATDIRMRSDGRKLFIHAHAHDSAPTDWVTRYTRDCHPPLPFKDDSMEFFFCPGPKHPYYYQICVSCTGVYSIYRCRNRWGAKTMIFRPWTPASLAVNVRPGAAGFVIDVEVALADIGLGENADAGSVYLQVVRNWRGQLIPGARLLQLFPQHIYAEQSDRPANHDRRAFRKVPIAPPPASSL